MPETEPLELLMESLQKRDININHDELQAALQGEHNSTVGYWIAEHLGPDTLLTRDELMM